MNIISDRINLLTDLRDIYLLQGSIDNLNKSIDMLQKKVDEHPISKYKNYRPKSSAERKIYEDTINDLSKIVGPLHKIITLRNFIEKKMNTLKDNLQKQKNRSYEELMLSLEENERALVTSSLDNPFPKGSDLEEYEKDNNLKGSV